MGNSKEVDQMFQQFDPMGISEKSPKMGAEMMQEPKEAQIVLVENKEACPQTAASGGPDTFFAIKTLGEGAFATVTKVL
jgi:hypothetical protein